MSALSGKTVLVTGGGSGLGRDVALQAAAAGARVALMDVRKDRLEGVRAEVNAAGGTCKVIGADLTAEADCARAVDEVVTGWGQLDVLVNSAGIFYGGPIVSTPMAEYDRIHNVNVRGLYCMCREAAKVMLPRKRGDIVNISSIAGKRGILHESAYSSGKWAVVGLGECLALELGPEGIRVTTICPGGMQTPFWDGLGRSIDPTKMLRSADVAQSIVQILSLPEGVVVKEALVYLPGR